MIRFSDLRALQKLPPWFSRAAGPAGIAALATFFALLVLHWSGYSLRQISTGYIGAGGDTLINSWTISQAIDNLAHRPLDLGYSPILYGDPAPFAYTIAPYGIALIAWPIYALTGGNLILTYNLVMIASFPLTALMAYWLCRVLLRASWHSAALAALMVTFAQPRMAQWGHIEQMSTHLLLLTLVCLHQLLDSPRIRWGAALGIAAWLLLLTSGYLAMAAMAAGAIVLGVVLVRGPAALDRRRVMLLAGAAALALLLAIPFLAFRFQNPVFSQGRSYDEIVMYSTPLEGFAAGTSLLYSGVVPEVEGEFRLFLGFVPIGLAALAWRLRKTPHPADQPPRLLGDHDVVLAYGLITVVGFVLALGPVLKVDGNRIAPMPYLLVMQLPGFGYLRVAARFIEMAVIGTAVLSAFALDRWAGRLARPAAWLATSLITLALAAELFPYTGGCSHRVLHAFDDMCTRPHITTLTPRATPPVYPWLAAQPPGSAVLHIPVTGPNAYNYYAWLPDQRQPMLNGEGVSFFPGWFSRTDWGAFPDLRIMVFLKQRGIRYVVVHRDLLTPALATRLDSQLDRYEAAWGEIPLVKQFGGDWCYELRITPVAELRLEFDEPVPGSGWGEPEVGEGKTFQWIGDGATLDLPLANDAPLSIRFQTYSALTPESLASLALWVNGREIHLDRRPGDGTTTLFEGTIPQSALGGDGELTTLTIITRGAARPIDLGRGPDTRLLSVALDWLELR